MEFILRGISVRVLQDNTRAHEKDCWGEDIAHDFLSKQLMTGAIREFLSFIAAYE
jgi:hypothetical protein